MAEIGIDLRATGAHPKRLDEAAVHASDVVITMGCGDACPIFPGKRYEDWKLDDPAGQGIDAVRPIRDEIRRHVEALIDIVRTCRAEPPQGARTAWNAPSRSGTTRYHAHFPRFSRVNRPASTSSAR